MNVPDAPLSPTGRPDAPPDLSTARLMPLDSKNGNPDVEGPPDSGPLSPVRLIRGIGAGVLSIVTVFYGACTLALLAYIFVNPWTTGVQIQRRFETDAAYEKHYDPRPLSALAPALPVAVVAAEDTRFFEHNGIDWKAIGEAIEENRDGDDQRRGGSTITQQLVKNLFLTTHSTYFRKALELPLTYLAELILSKARILELYLNVIEWGPGVYGAQAAAQYHYGQSASHLTRFQAASLAACIPNPLVREPQTVGWYRDVILNRMDVLGRLPLPPRSSQTDAERDRVLSPPAPRRSGATRSPPEVPDSVATDSIQGDSLRSDTRSPSPPNAVPVTPAPPASVRTDSTPPR